MHETPVEQSELMKVHNKPDLFKNFSFVNETTLGGTTEQYQSESTMRKNSFDDLPTQEEESKEEPLEK